VKSDELKQIRIGKHADKIRVVLDLAQGGAPPGRIIQDEQGLRILLGNSRQ
jgi:hypothetical protein